MPPCRGRQLITHIDRTNLLSGRLGDGAPTSCLLTPSGDGMLIATTYGEVIYVRLPSFAIISVYQQRDANGALLSGITVAAATFMRGGTLAAFAVNDPVRCSPRRSIDVETAH